MSVELLDPMRPCRRCKGTGIFHIWSGPIDCRNCGGTGKIPSVRDSRRLGEASDRRNRLVKAMYARAEERDGRRNGSTHSKTRQGQSLLEQDEPHRLPALLDSLEAGRVDEVIDALIAYRDARSE